MNDAHLEPCLVGLGPLPAAAAGSIADSSATAGLSVDTVVLDCLEASASVIDAVQLELGGELV